MEKIRVILNRESNTLDVWFDDPENNKVIGFENFNLFASRANVPIEVMTT